MKRTACVIGLGSMGYGAAVSLLRAGIEVQGVDRGPEALERFREAGGKTATSPEEGARGAEIIFTFVVNANQTEEVLFGASGAASQLEPGSIVVTCATVLPAFAEKLGKRLAEMNILMLDAPVSGGSAKAAAGQITIMGAGTAEAFDKAEPFLQAIASKVYRLGDAPGVGSQVKMINQLLAGVHIAAAAEAMALGMKIGLDPRKLYEVIANSAGSSWMFQNRVPHILAGDYAPHSAIDIFVKDLGIVLDTGKSLDFPLPITEAAHRLFATASEKGLGREDDSAVVKIYAETGQIELPEQSLERNTPTI
jgi:L-threonate 2-dehydrogenase